MTEQKLSEGLNRIESVLFSELVGKRIVIEGVEFTNIKDKEQQDIENAYVRVVGEEKPYRTSGKAILNQLHGLEKTFDKGNTVACGVGEVKSKSSKYKYIALIE